MKRCLIIHREVDLNKLFDSSDSNPTTSEKSSGFDWMKYEDSSSQTTNTGTLSLAEATYARSALEIKNLQNDFSTDIENMIKVLNGDKHTAFKKIITQNWTGPDAEKFLNDIEKTRKLLETNLRKLKGKFNSALTDDEKQFASLQEKLIK